MKHRLFKLSTVLLLFLFLGVACEKDEIEYADETIIVSNNPGISVYKMDLDYIDKVWIQITSEGKLNRVLCLDDNSIDNYKLDSNNRLIPNYRYLLKSGYIVGDANRNAAYTNITFQEYYNYNKKNGVNSWPDELIKPRIVDKNPYQELYWMGCLDCKIKEFTLAQINEMIENGTLEEHFTKVK